MSIRLRLTLWYSGILAVTLILFSIIVYMVADNVLHSEINISLQVKFTEIINNSYETAPLLFKLPIRQFTSPDTYIQVLYIDPDGKLQFNGNSTNLGDERLPMDQALLAAALQNHASFQDTYVEGVHLRQYNRAVFPKDLPHSRNVDPEDMKPVGVIQVARSLEPIDNTLRQLRTILIVTSACSIALAGIIGWLMAKAALAPIARITQEAQEIGQAEDLNRRVAQPNVMDEAGRLAATFNNMLSRLQASIERQKATLVAQRRFVADASHELRTPLTTIRGNVALLQRMVTHSQAGFLPAPMHDHESEAVAIQEPEQLEALDDIAAEAERMSRLVNDMLTLARADAGQQLTRIPVNLRAPIEEVYRHARRLRDERNPAIKMSLEADDDITVLGDPDALRQLFLILIDNAVKYTPGAGQVDIRLTREGNQAVLRVSDTGIGISAEDLPYIFERFYRADRARGQGGTGLGLAIAKWIAEEHGGSLSATSKPNEGSTFTLVLPAQPA